MANLTSLSNKDCLLAGLLTFADNIVQQYLSSTFGFVSHVWVLLLFTSESTINVFWFVNLTLLLAVEQAHNAYKLRLMTL